MYTITGLKKRFGDLVILKGIDLMIEPEKTTVIIGPSGSGKTTLLRCINLLEMPTEGKIDADGTVLEFPCKKQDKKTVLDIRKKTGMVFQGFYLFPHKTVLENIMEGPVTVLKKKKKEAVQEALKLLDKVGLSQKKDFYPSQLSGGQQQRVAIARALAMKPEILLFDEPTSALDPELEMEVLELIKELSKEKRTILIVTHKMSFARDVSDEIVFVDEGIIAKRGSYEELDNSNNERIRQFLHMME